MTTLNQYLKPSFEEHHDVDGEDLNRELLQGLIASQEHFTEVMEERAIHIDATAAVASLEGHMDILQHGLETGQYSPQYAASLHLVMEGYQELLEGFGTVPSLESYGHDNLEEYYQVSLESLSGLYKKITGLLQGAKTRIARRFKILGSAKGVATRSSAKLSELESRLNGWEGSDPVTFSARGLLTKINFKGVVPSDVVAAMDVDLPNRTIASITVPNRMVESADAVARAAIDMVTKDMDAGMAALIAVGDPVGEVDAKIISGESVFGTYYRREGREIVKLNTYSVKDSLAKLAKMDDFFMPKSVKTSRGPEELTLHKSQVQTILNNLRSYLEVHGQIVETGRHIDNKAARSDSLYRPRVDEFGNELDPTTIPEWAFRYAVNLMESASLAVLGAYIDIEYLIVSFLQLAERAIETAEKQTTMAE